ncbi:bifunctional phosphoglucose/phosphomannose isomerase [Candidatus Woesearchaeota archaeon]|nr:MAG: bifunctional phosphoglucose/phosphomannose isomerase [Candidatus Woesearchaeota archaeon]
MTDYDELIKELDPHDVRGNLLNLQSEIFKGIDAAKDVSIIEEINKIIILGLGGSALPGYLLKQYLNDFHIPIYVIEDYDIPSFVDKESLVFVISYSGNTEETLSMYRQAAKTGAKVITMSSGGKLKDLAEFNKGKHIPVIPGLAPRQGYGLMFFSLLTVLENSKIIPEEKDNIKKLVNALKTDFETMGKNLAMKISGKIPLIYASTRLSHVAWKWKINFNETAKIPAFYDVFPGLNHNEINMYQNSLDDYYVILLRDEKEHPRVSKHMDISKKIIKDAGVEVTEIGIKGDCYLTRIFSTLVIGDWTAYYLAIMNETDPFEVKIIERLKEDLKK